MKKRYKIIFLIIVLSHIFFRLSELKTEITDYALYTTAYVVILPFVYAFISLCFIKTKWKAIVLNCSALITAAGIITIYTAANPPLTEFGLVIMQIPSLLISFLAAHITFSAKNKKWKITSFTLFLIVALAISAGLYYFTTATIGMAEPPSL